MRSVLPLVALVALSLGAIDSQELLCESGVARLASCCPDFRPRDVSCDYIDRSPGVGCGGDVDVTYPTLRVEESRCVMALDCATIRRDRLCERVQALEPDRIYDGARSSTCWQCPTPPRNRIHRTHEPVCR